MQGSTNGFVLGLQELIVYDNLIKQYIKFKKQEDDYVSPEDIDELFENNNNE